MAENQAQAQEITLTLNPEELEKQNDEKLTDLQTESDVLVSPENPEVTTKIEDPVNESKLSESEKKTVEDFAKQIDITQSNIVLQYGSAAQKRINEFSDSALASVRNKDLGEVGSLLGSLVTELKDASEPNEKKGFLADYSIRVKMK